MRMEVISTSVYWTTEESLLFRCIRYSPRHVSASLRLFFELSSSARAGRQWGVRRRGVACEKNESSSKVWSSRFQIKFGIPWCSHFHFSCPYFATSLFASFCGSPWRVLGEKMMLLKGKLHPPLHLRLSPLLPHLVLTVPFHKPLLWLSLIFLSVSSTVPSVPETQSPPASASSHPLCTITKGADVTDELKAEASNWGLWESSSHPQEPPGSGSFHLDYSENHQERVLVLSGRF